MKDKYWAFLSVSLLLLWLPLVAWTCPADAPLKAWIDKKEEGANARISGMVLNNGQQQLNLTYRMLVDHRSPAGRSSNTQGDDFVLAPGQQLRLSEVQLALSEKSQYRIILEILQNGQRVAVDSLVHQMPPPAPPQKPLVKASEDLELDGLIIDDTRTKVGGDFYDLFYRGWTPPQEARDYTIRIKELPARGRIARIAILVNNEQVTQRIIQPRSNIVEMQAGQAIRIVYNQLKNRAGLKKELESEDQQGSGIF
ncbi:MAG: curli-like amyloid fiber formation chaperone CsgH [Bacteroidota bacterium]